MLRLWLNRLFALGILLAPAIALAQEFNILHDFGGHVFPSGPCSSTPVAYMSTQTSTVDGTSFTFNGVSIGDPPCGSNVRVVVTFAGCHAITSGAQPLSVTVNGVGGTEVWAEAATALTVLVSRTSVATGTTADIVFSSSGAADSTCERLVAMVFVVITSSATPVDIVADGSPTGDFDLANVAVTSGGGEVVGIVAYPNNACGDLDATFNGTETVTVDVNTTLEAAITYSGGHFTADSTETIDDYTNISCGTETDGAAIAASWGPPS